MSPANNRRGSAVLSAAAAAAIVVGASSSASPQPPPCSSSRPLATAAATSTSSLPLNAPFGLSRSAVESLRGGETEPSASASAAGDGPNVRGGAVGEKKSNRKKKKKSRKKSKQTKADSGEADAGANTNPADTSNQTETTEKESRPENDEKPSEDNSQQHHHRSTHSHAHSHHKQKSKSGTATSSNSQQDAIIASIMGASDHYEVLGVTKSATEVEIKKAYRRRAVRTHPDKLANSDRTAFDKVAKAYEVLSDETKRGLYDRFGDEGVEAGGNPNPGFGGFGSGGMFGAASAEEVFSRYFGGTGGRGVPNSFNPFQPRNMNKKFEMEVDLEDLYNGITRKVTMAQPPTTPNGRRTRKTVEVTIQRGMMAGQSIVLPGEMDQVPNSAPADIIFVLAQRRHETFTRRGHDLAIVVTISLREALCGFRRSFIHLDGRTVVIAPPRGRKIYQEKKQKQIEPNADEEGETGGDDEVEQIPHAAPIIIRSGDIHVLKGEGMPKPAGMNSRGGGYGDLYVQYKVEMPSAASGAGNSLTIEERDELDRLLRKLEGSTPNGMQGTELMAEEIDADGNKIRYMQRASAEDFGKASGPFETYDHHGEEHLYGDDEDPSSNSFFQAFGGRGFPTSGFHYYSSSSGQGGDQQCQQM